MVTVDGLEVFAENLSGTVEERDELSDKAGNT